MHAAAIRVELRLPGARSLKEKRSALRPVVEGLRRAASLSVAEVDHHDAWQRSALGIAAVAPDAGGLERLLTEAVRYLDERLEIEVVATEVSYLEVGV
jgi:uncharacterized protein